MRQAGGQGVGFETPNWWHMLEDYTTVNLKIPRTCVAQQSITCTRLHLGSVLEYNPLWSVVMPDDWIASTEAAEVSGYHPEHIRELIRDGKIEARKFGTIWQVSRSSLLAYLEAAEKIGDKRWGPKTAK